MEKEVIVNCPNCGAEYDVQYRVSGDIPMCASCGQLFQVWFRSGGRVIVVPYTTYPEEFQEGVGSD